MLYWNIDGIIVDGDGVIWEGLEGQTAHQKASVLMSKLDRAQSQQKHWEQEIAIIKTALEKLMTEEQTSFEDRQTGLRIGWGKHVSCGKKSIDALREKVELTEDEWKDIIWECYSTVAPKAFSDAAAARKVPVVDIEGAIKVSPYVQLRVIPVNPTSHPMPDDYKPKGKVDDDD